MIEIRFGGGGNSSDFQGEGWSGPEDGCTWTQGTRATLRLGEIASSDYLLTLQLSLFLAPQQRCQRVRISIGDSTIACFAAVRPGYVEFYINKDVLAAAGKPTIIGFTLFDASRPSQWFAKNADDRMLALCFHKVTLEALPDTIRGLDLSAVAMKIESLGSNCEFGLVQRRAGAEPLGLLRFATSHVSSLVSALDNQFQGLGSTDNVELVIHGTEKTAEWMVLDRAYGFVFHTHIHPDMANQQQVLKKEGRRLPWLAEKLLRDMREAEKLFIYQGNEAQSIVQIKPLLERLKSYNVENKLLLCLQDPKRAGELEKIDESLAVCYLSEIRELANYETLLWKEWQEILSKLPAINFVRI